MKLFSFPFPRLLHFCEKQTLSISCHMKLGCKAGLYSAYLLSSSRNITVVEKITSWNQASSIKYFIHGQQAFVVDSCWIVHKSPIWDSLRFKIWRVGFYWLELHPHQIKRIHPFGIEIRFIIIFFFLNGGIEIRFFNSDISRIRIWVLVEGLPYFSS